MSEYYLLLQLGSVLAVVVYINTTWVSAFRDYTKMLAAKSPPTINVNVSGPVSSGPVSSGVMSRTSGDGHNTTQHDKNQAELEQQLVEASLRKMHNIPSFGSVVDDRTTKS